MKKLIIGLLIAICLFFLLAFILFSAAGDSAENLHLNYYRVEYYALNNTLDTLYIPENEFKYYHDKNMLKHTDSITYICFAPSDSLYIGSDEIKNIQNLDISKARKDLLPLLIGHSIMHLSLNDSSKYTHKEIGTRHIAFYRHIMQDEIKLTQPSTPL